MDMHVWDLVGTSGITRILLICTCQQGVYPRGHPTPLASNALIYNSHIFQLDCTFLFNV